MAAKPAQMRRTGRGGAWKGNSTTKPQEAARGREMASAGAVSRNNSAGKINVQNRQISKPGFYKMFSRSFAAFKIYLYLRAENPAKKLQMPFTGNL